jgi:hypothetical protein
MEETMKQLKYSLIAFTLVVAISISGCLILDKIIGTQPHEEQGPPVPTSQISAPANLVSGTFVVENKIYFVNRPVSGSQVFFVTDVPASSGVIPTINNVAPAAGIPWSAIITGATGLLILLGREWQKRSYIPAPVIAGAVNSVQNSTPEDVDVIALFVKALENNPSVLAQVKKTLNV